MIREKAGGVVTLWQERGPPNFTHKYQRNEDVDGNHLSPFFQPLLPERKTSHLRCFGRNSSRAAGLGEVDACWRAAHFCLALAASMHLRPRGAVLRRV